MPIAAFIDDGHLPALGLTNAWGYNPVTYFAIDPRLAPRGPQELRFLTDLYRKNGISVILDVVYNHTGEGDNMGPVLSLKGLDAQDLLPARRSRRQAASGQRRRHRQHAALRPSGDAAAGDREPALLGRGDRRLRLPLRPRDGARARAGVQPRRQDAADDQGRSGAQQVPARRRAVGSGSGRLWRRQVRQGIPRVERHLSRRGPRVLARRAGQDRRARRQGRGLGRDLQFRRPQAERGRQFPRRA